MEEKRECQARNPYTRGGYPCYLPMGHEGSHMSEGIGDDPYSTWTNEEAHRFADAAFRELGRLNK